MLLSRVGAGRYLARRALFLAITFLVTCYAIVLIANFGGLMDEVIMTGIVVSVNEGLREDTDWLGLARGDPEAAEAERQRRIEAEITRQGLRENIVTRSARQTWRAVTLQLGDSLQTQTATGGGAVWALILERLPRTVLLFTTATLVAAYLGIMLGLRLAQRALSTTGRGLSLFALTTSVVPSWIFGMLLIMVFAVGLQLLPAGGFVSVPAPTDPTLLMLDVTYHLILPMMAVIFGSFGAWAYITRNFVLQVIDEDFVTTARAKGLPSKVILQRHVLRAAAPPIVTMLALALVASWTGAIVMEIIFNWPGIGLLYWQAIGRESGVMGGIDAPVVIGVTVVYAFLFVLTMFILDLVYSLLDPRVRALGQGPKG